MANVEEYTTDQIFRSVDILAEPTGGTEMFSRRVHDYLKAEVDKAHIPIDNITEGTAISFIVERDGSLINTTDTPLRATLDAFISQERKWSPGIMSGLPAVYELKLQLYADYLQGRAEWPKHPEWERRQMLSREKRGTHYLYSSLVRPDTPLVSFVYDAVLGQYRFPIYHADSSEDCSQLIMDIQENANKPTYRFGVFHRVYFYWSRY